MTEEDVLQVLFPSALRAPLEEWLEERGLYLSPPMQFSEDDLPTHIIGIKT